MLGGWLLAGPLSSEDGSLEGGALRRDYLEQRAGAIPFQREAFDAGSSSNPTRLGGQKRKKASPFMSSPGMDPMKRESSELARLSPITK